MKWYYAVPTLVAAILAAGCASDKPANPLSPSGRPSYALKNNANVDLDQWANGTPTTAASWQNGDLNGNNSTYAEGKVVPFRLALENLGATQHFITIQYDFIANGHKAYDFLTNADATETTIYNHICEDGGGGVSSLCGSNTDVMPGTVPYVDVDYLIDTFEGPSGKTVAGAIAGSSSKGTRKLRIYGISSAGQVSLSQMSHASAGGNSETAQFLATFTPDVNINAVLFVWGGHLAESGYWDNTPNGSSTIQGAPWHMRSLNLDGGGGANQDRSIQPSAIVPPAVTVVKVANPVGPISAGNDIGFDITVTNGGPGSAFNVTINDPLPTHAGISWSTTTSGCSIAGTPQVLTCTIPTLLATAGSNTFTARVTSHTTTAACAVITNDGATVTAANIPADPNHPIVSGPASVTVNCPDLHILKTAKPAGPVSAGDNIGFEIVVSNGAGAGNATNVGFSDPLPNVGGTWTISSQDGTACSITSGTLTCSGIDLAAGGSYTVNVGSATTAVACGTVDNTATITGTTISSTAHVTVKCPSISITKTADAATVDAGSPIGFTITVTNSSAAGTGTAKGVTVSDALPTGSGITWTIANSPAATPVGQWSITSGTLNLAATDLAPGASASVHVTSPTDKGSCTLYNNSASASLSNGTAPQAATASTTVQCPTISITKTADAHSVSAGTTIGFTITVTNTGAAGSATATGVTVNDVLPTGTGITWTISGSPAATPAGQWSITSGTLSLAATDLAPGGSASVHVTSPTTKNSCARYDNTASATVGNGGAPPNASDYVTVLCPNITLTKVADAVAVDSGQKIGFLITVTNTGAGTATGVTASDPLPTGAGISWSISSTPAAVGSWSITAGVLSLASTTLASGASASVHVESNTVGAVCKKYDNTASATLTNGTAPSDASASETVRCLPSITVTKTIIGGGATTFDFTQNNTTGTPLNSSYQMGNGGSTTTKLLQPGTYKLCEVLIPVGWSSSTFWSTTAQLDGTSVSPYNPDAAPYPAGQDLGNRCVDVTVTYGDHKTLAWTNRPPPGGDLRTIGYWKNWSSCTGGGQYTKALARNELYGTLDGNLPQTIGLLLLTADKQGCLNAVNILSKNDLKGNKMASDPAYNLAAQALAAMLNRHATNKVCPVGWPRLDAAQNLLVTIKFNGQNGYAKTMSAAQITQANTLAQQLDALNNNIAGYC